VANQTASMQSFEDVTDAMEIGIQAGLKLLIWGPPGGGKTASIEQFARKLNYHLETVIASTHDPTDFSGLPVVEGEVRDRHVVFTPPGWARRLADAKHSGQKGLVFFDEISTTPPTTQAALLRVIQEGVVGELVLGDHVTAVAAANPMDQAAGGFELAMPMANRFVHLFRQTHAETWVDGLFSNWDRDPVRLPDDWRERPLYGEAKARLGAYIRLRGSELHQPPDSTATLAWPSPRSWMMALTGLVAGLVAGKEDAGWQLVEGAVGNGSMLSFRQWWKHTDIPSVQEILAHPRTVKLPEHEDAQFVMAVAVADHLNHLAKPQEDLVDRGWEFLVRLATSGRQDVAAVGAHMMIKGQIGAWMRTRKLKYPTLGVLEPLVELVNYGKK